MNVLHYEIWIWIIKLNYYNIKLEDIVETWKDIKEIYSIYLNLIAW